MIDSDSVLRRAAVGIETGMRRLSNPLSDQDAPYCLISEKEVLLKANQTKKVDDGEDLPEGGVRITKRNKSLSVNNDDSSYLSSSFIFRDNLKVSSIERFDTYRECFIVSQDFVYFRTNEDKEAYLNDTNREMNHLETTNDLIVHGASDEGEAYSFTESKEGHCPLTEATNDILINDHPLNKRISLAGNLCLSRSLSVDFDQEVYTPTRRKLQPRRSVSGRGSPPPVLRRKRGGARGRNRNNVRSRRGVSLCVPEEVESQRHKVEEVSYFRATLRPLSLWWHKATADGAVSPSVYSLSLASLTSSRNASKDFTYSRNTTSLSTSNLSIADPSHAEADEATVGCVTKAEGKIKSSSPTKVLKESAKGLGVRLRRAKSTVQKELRKTLRSLSMTFTQSEFPFDPMYPQEEIFENLPRYTPHQEEELQHFVNKQQQQQQQQHERNALPWRRSDYLKESQHKQHLQHKQQDTCLTVTGQERPEVSVTDTDDERRLLAPSPISRVSPLSQSEWDIRRSWGAHVGGEIGLADGVECSSLSQSVCRLAQRVERGDEAPLCLERGEDAPLSLPFISTSSSASSTQSTQEGMFQKFKKSLSLRLHKKSLRGSIAPPEATPPPPTPPNEDELLPPEGMTFPRRRGSAGGVEDSRNFIFGHPIFRSSKERRRGGPQNHRERRASKCNSGDSGDSGIELTNGSGVSKGGEASHSRSPHSSPTGNRETTDNAPPTAVATALPPPIEPCMRRAWSEVGGSIASHAHENPTIVSHHQPVSYGRQNSSPQPLKLRPKHLPNNRSVGSMQRPGRLKRSFASSRLRRSASQPLDLDRVTNPPPTPSSSSPNEQNTSGGPKASNGIRKRRPSFGNLLSDEESSAEEEEEEEELNEGGCVGVSDCEGYRKDLKRCLEEEDLLVYAEALWDHVTLDSDELVFKAGDLITVVENSDRDWWWGRISHRAGWFPAAFVRLLVNQGDHADSLQSGRITSSQWLRNGRTLPSFSHEQIRANVINEIITTERDFVKHLRDVVHGYLKQVRKRQDMFSKECVAAIFGNIEALYEFQSNFFQDLEQCIDYEHTDRSCIGQCFIRNRAKFEIYSEYCNNHPNAVSQLQELYLQQKYVHFFEACRLLQAMIDISLDGFLLTPVQKICKYPLQLQELLKYTKPSHPDYSHVQGALEAMKQVALMVNERKRRMECLEKIACWQMAVEGWEGPDLLDDSSQLIEQGEATKGAFSSWPKEVTLFLFDHQLIYCKRDLLKRNTFVYRGRINLDLCEITDIPHGRAESSKSGTVHHAWKVHCLNKSKTYVFSCKSIGEKQKWLCAFRRERELVAADETAGFVVSEKAKQVAKTAARNHRNRPKRPRSLWFSFAGPKKSRGYRRVQHPPAPHPPPQAV